MSYILFSESHFSKVQRIFKILNFISCLIDQDDQIQSNDHLWFYCGRSFYAVAMVLILSVPSSLTCKSFVHSLVSYYRTLEYRGLTRCLCHCQHALYMKQCYPSYFFLTILFYILMMRQTVLLCQTRLISHPDSTISIDNFFFKYYHVSVIQCTDFL